MIYFTKNIYLVGFMATGKTAVAKSLAKRLGLSFFDMDEEIERREKMPITEIFEIKGEPYFRALEKKIVGELSKRDSLVVACGGGTFADQQNIDLLKQSGFVVCLTSTPETILKRSSAFANRPLLNVGDPRARIEELLIKRRPFYLQAHCTVDADRLSVDETADAVLMAIGSSRIRFE